jgi:carnitine O-acetyltransferase
VPSLDQTLERYLETVKPIVNEVQYERTRVMAKAFGSSNGPGPRLQEKLLQLREEKDNWVSTYVEAI